MVNDLCDRPKDQPTAEAQASQKRNHSKDDLDDLNDGFGLIFRVLWLANGFSGSLEL